MNKIPKLSIFVQLIQWILVENYIFSSSINQLIYVRNTSTLFAISSSHLHQLRWSSSSQTLLLLHRRVPLHSTIEQDEEENVSVFLYHPVRHILIICSRSEEGSCILYDADDISRFDELDSSIETNKLGCSSGCHSYLSSSSVIRTAWNQMRNHIYGNVLFSNIEIDRTSFRFHIVDLNLSTDRRTTKALPLLDEPTVESEYLFGFDHSFFSYFLMKSSRLARLCQNPSIMSISYEEVSLIPCDPKVRRSTITVAFYASNQLYIVYEHTLCIYSLDTIERAFETSKIQCHLGYGYRLQNFIPNAHGRIKCEKNEEELSKNFGQCRHESYKANSFMDGSVGVIGTLLYQDEDPSTKILFIFVQNNLVILGTNKSQILKFILLDGNEFQFLHRFIPSETGLNRNYAVDEEHRSLIIAIGNELHRYPYDSCSLYDNCRSCVTSRQFDSRICRWYQGHCTSSTVEEIQEFGCPPLVESISPLNASVNTDQVVLQIKGSFSDVLIESIKVTVDFPLPNQNQFSCFIKDLTNQTLTCLLFVPKQPMEGVISLSIQPAKNLSLIDADISGAIDFSEKFRVFIPKPILTPNFGPGAGGTKIQIRNLSYSNRSDLFSTMKIFLGEENCPIIRYDNSADLIECVNQACPDDFQRLELRIFVENRIWLLEKTFFQCRLNPIVFDWNPKQITLSGGYQMMVTGINLDVVINPKLKLTSRLSLYEWISSCTSSSASTMNCITPNLRQDRKFKLPLELNVSFVMDNMNVVPKEEILVVINDPIYYPFDNLRQAVNSTGLIHFRGSNLASSHTIDQVDVQIDQIHNACFPSNFTEEDLFCVLSKSAALNFKTAQPIVEISVGSHLNFSIGRIFFASSIQSLPLVVQEIPSMNVSRTNSLTIFGLLFASAFAMLIVLSTLLLISYRRFGQISSRLKIKENLLPTELRSIWSRFEERWHFDRKDLSISDKVGQGCLIDIYRGAFQTKQMESIDVFVKVLRERTFPINKTFLEEILQTRHFSHRNVFSFFGIVWDSTFQAMVVYPTIKNGDLQNYLSNQIHRTSIKQLLSWAFQIADGMEYLASCKFVHRDLAARNCLLDDHWNCRIADFSLTTISFERDYYRTTRPVDKKRNLSKSQLIPIRWMSPEAIESSLFTTQSDIWSFGIVLWEIFNQGRQPYGTIDNDDILKHLKGGYRMASSSSCPPALYRSVMVPCWHINPLERPTFTKLGYDLRHILKKTEIGIQEPACSSADEDDTTIVQRYPIDQTEKKSSSESTSSSIDEPSYKLYATVQSNRERTTVEEQQSLSNLYNTAQLLPEYVETSIVQNFE